MPSGFVTRTAGKVANRVPGLRRVPVVQLLSAAEIALLTRDHVMRLTPDERRRLLTLVRIGRGRRARLTEAQRTELEEIIVKLTRAVGGALS